MSLLNKSRRKSRPKSNPVPLAKSVALNRAAKLYEDFTGHEAEELGYFDTGKAPEIAVVIGELEAVIYNTVRDGVSERYTTSSRLAPGPCSR